MNEKELIEKLSYTVFPLDFYLSFNNPKKLKEFGKKNVPTGIISDIAFLLDSPYYWKYLILKRFPFLFYLSNWIDKEDEDNLFIWKRYFNHLVQYSKIIKSSLSFSLIIHPSDKSIKFTQNERLTKNVIENFETIQYEEKIELRDDLNKGKKYDVIQSFSLFDFITQFQERTSQFTKKNKTFFFVPIYSFDKVFPLVNNLTNITKDIPDSISLNCSIYKTSDLKNIKEFTDLQLEKLIKNKSNGITIKQIDIFREIYDEDAILNPIFEDKLTIDNVINRKIDTPLFILDTIYQQMFSKDYYSNFYENKDIFMKNNVFVIQLSMIETFYTLFKRITYKNIPKFYENEEFEQISMFIKRMDDKTKNEFLDNLNDSRQWANFFLLDKERMKYKYNNFDLLFIYSIEYDYWSFLPVILKNDILKKKEIITENHFILLFSYLIVILMDYDLNYPIFPIEVKGIPEEEEEEENKMIMNKEELIEILYSITFGLN